MVSGHFDRFMQAWASPYGRPWRKRGISVTTLQGRLILQVTWRHCSDPRDDTESYGLGVGLGEMFSPFTEGLSQVYRVCAKGLILYVEREMIEVRGKGRCDYTER